VTDAMLVSVQFVCGPDLTDDSEDVDLWTRRLIGWSAMAALASAMIVSRRWS